MTTRFQFIAAAALAIFAAPAMGQDQTKIQWPKTPREARMFVDAMPNDAWMKVIAASASLQFFVGKPIIAVANPFDEAITLLMCDQKWALVGTNAYLKAKGAPEAVPPHRITFIPTDGFDRYCKTSLVGITESGSKYDAILSIPGDFTNSVMIMFDASRK